MLQVPLKKEVKKDVFSCIEVSVEEREGVASLESCLEKWLSEEHVQYWKCTTAANLEIV